MIWPSNRAAGLPDLRHTAYSLTGNWPTVSIEAVVQFFYIILLVIVVSALAYATTRMIGSARFARGGRRNLQIVESISVGPQSFVHLLRAGNQYLLIGVTRGRVNLLARPDAAGLNIPEAGAGFEALLSRFTKTGAAPENGAENGEGDKREMP